MYERLRMGLWFRGHWKGVFVLLLHLITVGCSAGYRPLSEQVRLLNRGAGEVSDIWQTGEVEAGGLHLAAVRNYTRLNEGQTLRVYIEGDGRAYISKGVVSGDPTPLNPVGLNLAVAERDGAVMYVGRPCQWLRGPECKDRSLWTSARFTPQVAAAYAALVAAESGDRPVEIVGYSGGAWVALQVAARLPNVVRVVTVAGNLLPDFVNAHHKVTRIPVEAYPQGHLASVPVVAYVGSNDSIVPRGVVEAYRQEVGAADVQVREVEATHGEGWEALYGRI